MVLNIARRVFSPLLGLFIFVLGSGMFTTLVTLRLSLEGSHSTVVGLMTGAYYAGLVVASFRVERFISRVGHIRAFSAFASLLSVISLLQGIFIYNSVWFVLRFVGGFATAGLFVVVESWLLALGTIKTRGQVLALYMMSLYAAQALGQFLINLGNPKTFILFAIAAILSSLSIIPLSMTRSRQPELQEPSLLDFKALYKASASGVIGCFIAGVLLGSIYGLLPLWAQEEIPGAINVSWIMALTITGGMLLQYPIGRLSDQIERRIVLLGISICIGIVSLIAIFCAHRNLYLAGVLAFIFGGFSFTLYPVSISQACDNLETKDVVAGTQALLLAYSIGAMVGPIIAPLFMRLLTPNGLWVYFSFIGFVVAVFFAWRRTQKTSAPSEEAFISVPQTTPVVAELDPRHDEKDIAD
jgi:MFS family permease